MYDIFQLDKHIFLVRSKTESDKYHMVTTLETNGICTCDDYLFKRDSLNTTYSETACKHIRLVDFIIQKPIIHSTIKPLNNQPHLISNNILTKINEFYA